MRQFKKVIVFFLTCMTWLIVAAVLSWHIVVFLWDILYLEFSNNLYVAESIKITNQSIFLILSWTIIVYIISKIWVKHNKSYVAKKIKANLNFNKVIYIGNELQWSEALISNVNSQHILEEIDKVKNNLSVVLYKPTSILYEEISQPQKLLNTSISLMKNKQYFKGVSYLRIIIEHPESQEVIKNIAKVKLSQCLYELGYKDLANRLVKDVI